MPLFGGKKFTPKKPPMRKQNSLSALNTLDDNTREPEFGLETGPIELRLGGHQVVFENGEWISSMLHPSFAVIAALFLPDPFLPAPPFEYY